MRQTTSYGAKIVDGSTLLSGTVNVYRKAVAFCINAAEQEWDSICPIYKAKANEGQRALERMIHRTQKSPNPKYDFDGEFPNFPSYFRRAAISIALGAVSSYRSNYQNWLVGGKVGNPPKLTFDRNIMPTFFRGNMTRRVDAVLNGGECVLELKLYDANKKNWEWHSVTLRKQDVEYLVEKWKTVQLMGKPKSCAPVLEIISGGRRNHTKWRSKRGKKRKGTRCRKRINRKCGSQYSLRFAFQYSVELSLGDVDLPDRVVLGVDLGVNKPATCSAMFADGTVAARKVITFPAEQDRMARMANRARRAQREHGRCGGKKEWAKAARINDEISRKTAEAIVEFASLCSASVIVFEHLDTKGKKRGKNKWKLHMWRCKEIQKLVEVKAHDNYIRISRICAWGTSKYAFDGSGEVERHIPLPGQEKASYSVCRFKSGKFYDCDMSASYNIAARYFLREYCAYTPELKEELPCTSRRVWADLWNLCHPKQPDAPDKTDAA